jgi:hypothetical protein
MVSQRLDLSEKESRKRRSFREVWKEAVAKAEEAKFRQHFARSDERAFNTLLKLLGENYFKVIVRENSQGENWITRHKHPTPPRNLQALYYDKNLIVGMRFNILTRVLILDIDRGSLYHPANDEAEYRRLLGIFESMGLVGVEVVQSSFSGGIHLYIPLPKPVPSWLAAHALYVVLSKARFRIAKGHLEIFPNRKGFSTETIINYNGIRLPLQPGTGSYVLDSLTLAPLHSNLRLFVKHLQHHAKRQDMVAFKQVMEGAYQDFGVSSRGFVKGKNGGAADWHNDLLIRLEQGWTGDAQTNDLVFDAVKEAYVFQHLDGEELVQRTAAYMRSLPGYKIYCGHQHNLEQRVRDWLKSTKNLGYYPYTGEYRIRQGSHYGSTVEKTKIAGHEDGRKHNRANAARKQEARDKLAKVIRILRQSIREKSITALPGTLRGLLDLISGTAKDELGEGFSRPFLQKFKGLLERLRHFAQRISEVVKEEKTSEETAEPAAEKACSTETAEPAAEKACSTTLSKSEKSEKAETLMNKGVFSNRPNNEGVCPLNPPLEIAPYRQAWTILRYTGPVSSSLVRVLFENSTTPRLLSRFIFPGDLVRLTYQNHLREDQDGLVCVNLLTSLAGEQWLDSLFVKVDHLVPL